MATPVATSLPLRRERDATRDLATSLCAAVAVAALAVAPWSTDGSASALYLAAGASVSKWPRYAAAPSLLPVVLATAATLGFAWLHLQRSTAMFAAIALAWIFGQG